MSEDSKKRWLPKSTRIAGIKWKIQEKHRVLFPGTGEECEGVCHFDKHTIEVSTKSEDEFIIMSIFYHETLHALVESSGIVLTNTQEHGIIAQFERWMSANCDLRSKPRKPGKKKVTT